MELFIKKDQLKAALIFAAKKDIRKYLVAAHFDPAGFMVTTDGHRMLVQKVTAFDGESFTVPRAIIELAIKGCGKYGVIEVTRDKVANIGYTFDDGQFPQWRKVIPDSISGEPGAYNADYVADIKAAQEMLTGRTSHFTTMSIGQNGNAPSVFLLDDGAFGVIMPIVSKSAPCDIEDIQAIMAAPQVAEQVTA